MLNDTECRLQLPQRVCVCLLLLQTRAPSFTWTTRHASTGLAAASVSLTVRLTRLDWNQPAPQANIIITSNAVLEAGQLCHEIFVLQRLTTSRPRPLAGKDDIGNEGLSNRYLVCFDTPQA